jgi:hypothetical protein
MDENLEGIPPVQLMPGLQRQEINSNVLIIYHWYGGLGGFFTKAGEVFVFGLGLVFFILSLQSVVRVITHRFILTEALFSFFFLILGFVLVYRGLTLVFNRSVFIVNNTGLTVRHGPLPFSGASNLDLKHAEIRNVEWRKVGHSNNSSNITGFSKTGYSDTFDVVVITNLEKTYTLLTGIHAREYAFAIASEISRYL